MCERPRARARECCWDEHVTTTLFFFLFCPARRYRRDVLRTLDVLLELKFSSMTSGVKHIGGKKERSQSSRPPEKERANTEHCLRLGMYSLEIIEIARVSGFELWRGSSRVQRLRHRTRSAIKKMTWRKCVSNAFEKAIEGTHTDSSTP